MAFVVVGRVWAWAAMVVISLCYWSCFGGAEARHARSLGNGFTITKVEMVGAGCPPGSATYQISDNGVLVHFSQMYVNIKTDIPTAECIVSAHLDCAAGWSFKANKLYYGGYVRLEKNVQAKLYGSYKGENGGSPGPCTLQESWHGGKTGTMEAGVDESASCEFWTPCGDVNIAVLHTKLSVSVDSAKSLTADGNLVVDKLDVLLRVGKF